MDESQKADGRLEQRVSELESLFLHLQRTVQDLNDVLLDQHRQLTAVQSQMDRVLRDVDSLVQVQERPRRPEDEKPPHY